MDAFAALADPVRRGLLMRLATGPTRVVDLADAYDISRPAISKHLRLLSEAGLVSAEDRGRERHYRLEADGLRPVRGLLDQLTGTPPFDERVFDGLDLEIRRVGRDRLAATDTAPDQQPDQQEDTA